MSFPTAYGGDYHVAFDNAPRDDGKGRLFREITTQHCVPLVMTERRGVRKRFR